MALERGTRLFRTLFISDVHLGARGCQADRLLDFLRYHDAETIYLVGDIVDGWQLRSGWYWPQPHNDVVQKLLRKARKGARLVYLPGNHDEFLRDYYGTHFGGIEVVENAIHEAADGRRYLVVHGDVFDMVVKHARWLALLGLQHHRDLQGAARRQRELVHEGLARRGLDQQTARLAGLQIRQFNRALPPGDFFPVEYHAIVGAVFHCHAQAREGLRRGQGGLGGRRGFGLDRRGWRTLAPGFRAQGDHGSGHQHHRAQSQ